MPRPPGALWRAGSASAYRGSRPSRPVPKEGVSMQDQVECTLQHWQRIRPGAEREVSTGKADQLADWVRRSVCPIAAELMRRADFRELARWPLDNLLPGARCTARELVSAVDDGLIAWARALAAVVKRPAAGRAR